MTDTSTKIPEITVLEAQKRIEAGALLLDVREPNEYQETRIAGSQLLPLSELTARFEDELPEGREIIAQCRSGKRSAQATEFLRAQGYDATNMEGGILAWRVEGLPTEEG